ncbi:TPA: hypothetical protein MAZ58_005710 [Klebsiella pneumoniae]|nr:hypothetical protein [Klebsiella pneumoniae]HBT0380242.1 hypothetical protein [Klebsiella pneumoniae]HBT0501018.1 hypothetical protein [Klebsiella pneumoniae]HBT0507464.1 hypothetical protein [Klebsiella pneumoniae]
MIYSTKPNITTLKSILPGEKNPLSSTRPFK